MLAEGSQFPSSPLSLHTSQPRPLEAGSDEEKMEFLGFPWLLGLSTSTAEGMCLIPSWGTKILQALRHSQKKKKKKKKNYLKEEEHRILTGECRAGTELEFGAKCLFLPAV